MVVAVKMTLDHDFWTANLSYRCVLFLITKATLMDSCWPHSSRISFAIFILWVWAIKRCVNIKHFLSMLTIIISNIRSLCWLHTSQSNFAIVNHAGWAHIFYQLKDFITCACWPYKSFWTYFPCDLAHSMTTKNIAISFQNNKRSLSLLSIIILGRTYTCFFRACINHVCCKICAHDKGQKR